MIPDSFLEGFTELCIDASSIIYLLKSGLLGSLSAEVSLVSTPQVRDETGWPHLPVEALPLEESRFPAGSLSNDDSLVALAVERRSPVLSEDYEILMNAKEAGLEYYNTLMMLNYLLLKGRIAPDEYPEYLERLKECSHYSSHVLEQGDLVYKDILQYIGRNARS